jgi:hypothetical protein
MFKSTHHAEKPAKYNSHILLSQIIILRNVIMNLTCISFHCIHHWITDVLHIRILLRNHVVARGSVVGWGTMHKPQDRWLVFRWAHGTSQFTYSFHSHGPGMNPDSNRNEHEESSWGLKGKEVGGWPHRHLWVDMWDTRRLTTQYVSTAC